MNSLAWTTIGAFVCGVAVYSALAHWFPEIETALWAGIVGLAAVAGGAIGKAIAARRTRHRSGSRA